MKSEYTYYQFPLCLMQQTFYNPSEGLNIISSFGIVNYAQKFSENTDDVAKQLMYAYYRNPDSIQKSLYKTLQGYIDEGEIELDEDYNGFNGTEFNPTQETEAILNLFKRDEDFKKDAILFWQIYKASDSLNVNLRSIDLILNRYNKGKAILNSFEGLYGPDVWPSIKPLQLFEFRDTGKDLDIFRGYCAIRSVIGQREFNITHKKVIVCRMFGCKTDKALKAFIKSSKAAKELYDKYSKRYWIDWLLTELETRGFITKISYPNWGIFVSVTIKDKDSLAKRIIEKKSKRSLEKQEQAARKLIQQHIYNTTE